jgi:hypothetical protein
MQNDPSLMMARYLMTQLKVRFAAVRSGELDRGALSLEWVVIAIALIATAAILTTFVKGKFKSMESLMGS